MDFPALTLCPNQADTGEWVRTIVNNLEYDKSLSTYFASYMDTQVMDEMFNVGNWAK